MKTAPLLAAAAAALLMLIPSVAAAQSARVEVVFVDPEQFPDVRYSVLEELRTYLTQRAERVVPAGQTLVVEIPDLRLAGTYEWWRTPGSPNFRVIQDATPPRIALRFKLVDANGTVIAEGKRVLIDQNFVSESLVHLVGPLRYEKGLIDRWLASEFNRTTPSQPRT